MAKHLTTYELYGPKLLPALCPAVFQRRTNVEGRPLLDYVRGSCSASISEMLAEVAKAINC